MVSIQVHYFWAFSGCNPVLVDHLSFLIFLKELEKMKEIAKLKQLPPVYTGKWAHATDEEVEEELAKGTPYTYRFRVPKEGRLQIHDLIRGEVILFSKFHWMQNSNVFVWLCIIDKVSLSLILCI